MESLVVSFKANETQYCVLSVTDKAIEIKGICSGKSLVTALLESDYRRIADEIAYCEKKIKGRASEILFLLPSSIAKLECFETAAAVGQDGWIGKINRWVLAQLDPKNEKNIIIRIGMLRTPANVVYVSAATLPITLAQTLESAAVALKKQLRRIEPVVLGIVRKIESRKAFIVEADGEYAFLTAYVPNKGVFTIKIPVPLCEEEWDKTIGDTIGFAASALFDTSEAAFSYCCINSAVDQLMQKAPVDLIPLIHLSPDNLQIKRGVTGDPVEFLPLIISAAVYGEEEISKTALPQVNFIREEVQERIKKEQTEKKALFALKIFKAAAIFWILVSVGFMGFYYIKSSNSLPPQMESRFREAQQTLASMEKKTQIINEAYKSDIEIIRIVDNITILRPALVNIQRLEVTENGGVKIEAHSSAPELGNVYVQHLLQSGSQIVKAAFLERITSSNNGSLFTISGQTFR